MFPWSPVTKLAPIPDHVVMDGALSSAHTLFLAQATSQKGRVSPCKNGWSISLT